ncbi:uncharacterized protein F4822DRAFT_344807 [Hypoxylon trugodes]|uniref:uncharacterized protein n=1 Tax=Hypoxylon trugodes TaxID=326681 RepID=UPI00218D148A|nr:uncharacterized protein F4822DRAFT_344807 [Hypoxylon trugodes]KAI1385452.1 hypothetical protein F4822DRAFT_344807 [Hypoxylon trugodes]
MNQQPQAQVVQGQPGQQMLRLLRPEQMRSINYLTPEEKQKYEEGLRQLYTKMEQNPPDSQEHQAAKHKVADFSRMVYAKIKNIQAARNAQAGGSQAQTQSQAQPNQQAQFNQMQQQNAQGDLGQKPAGAPQGQQGPSRASLSATPNVASGSNTQPQIPKAIIEHVNQVHWNNIRPPAQVPQDQRPKWLNDIRQKYLRSLMTMESVKTRTQRLDAILKERQEKGQQLSPDDMKRFQDQKMSEQKNYTEAQRFVQEIRNQLKLGQGNNAQGQGAQPVGRPQPQNVMTSGPAANNPMQAAAASVNAAVDAAKNQQIAAVRAPQPQSQPQQPVQQPPQQPQHPGTPAAPATPSTSTQLPQQPHVQSVPTPTNQPQIKNEPTNTAPHPPPVNTTLAAAASAHVPSAGTPTQTTARVQTPQSAGQQATASQVRPLTHAAAVNRANSSTNVTGQQNNNPSGGVASTPGSNGLVSNANHSAHTHAHPQPSNTPALNPKMPISKNLPQKATETPQAVSTGGGNTPGRPSLGGGTGVGGGVMGQPVIPKMPVAQFDAEGEHVLSKKKLDELVRQVCGGGSPGADGNYLTPDVEESVLSVADNFVDNVLHTACRLAKERGSKILEIRDIQLVLERVYNIRIPGYTTDELRTVRKVQPSSNWISKIHAVQAAKVMPGKDDK